MVSNKWLFADYTSRHKILEFYNLISPKLPLQLRLACESKPYSRHLSIADSLLFWNPVVGQARKLSHDGYYSRLLPQFPSSSSENGDAKNGSETHLDYLRRVWGGGSLELIHREPRVVNLLQLAHEYRCLEKVTRTKWLKGDAFVVVERGIVDALSQKYILREERVLVYTERLPGIASTRLLSGIPQSQSSSSQSTDTKKETILADNFVFDRMDIILYGLLSKNPHRIHWDREYAQQIEKYKDIVVQGPFVIQVLATFAEWFLLGKRDSQQNIITKLKYRNVNFVYPGVPTQIYTRDGKQFVMRDKERPDIIYAVLTVEQTV